MGFMGLEHKGYTFIPNMRTIDSDGAETHQVNNEEENSEGEEAVEGPTETLEDFLSLFRFENGEILPSGCRDIHRVLYGYREGDGDRPSRLSLDSPNPSPSFRLKVHIDVDSVLADLQTLPLMEAVMIYPNPPHWMNITGSHQYLRRPTDPKAVLIDNTPHCLFGEVGLSWKIHAVFPSLSPPLVQRGQDYLPASLLAIWYDEVIYPALRKCLPEERHQHFSPSRQIFMERHPGVKMGHMLSPDYILQVTKTMHTIVADNDSLRCRFSGFFFHVSCKGVKGSMAVPLESLVDPAGFKAWSSRVTRVYCGIFGESAQKRMQVDIGAEFTAFNVSSSVDGPLQMLWRRKATKKMKMGLRNTPKSYEWWLTEDAAGSATNAGSANVVDFDREVPSVTHFQAYNLDKETMPSSPDGPTTGIQGKNMTWSSPGLRRRWEAMMRGIVAGSKTSWGCRMEVRMASRHLYDPSGALGYFQVCKEIQAQPSKYFLFIPTMQASRFKAANLWLIRDGAQRVEAATKAENGHIGPGLQEFMKILANLYKGFHRGMNFCPQRALVFGPTLTRKDAISYGLGYAIRHYGYPRLPKESIDWMASRGCRSGIVGRVRVQNGQVSEETMSLEALHTLADIEYQDVSDGVVGTTFSDLAKHIIKVFQGDMISATLKWQDTEAISFWNLAQVRQAISKLQGTHISIRRGPNTWKKLFGYLFPYLDDLEEIYVKPGVWSRVRYLPLYLTYFRLIRTYEEQLPMASLSQFRKELWSGFDKMDCVLRLSITQEFVLPVKGNLRIDLRNQEDLVDQ